MRKEWILTQDAFDALLAWLDPDREVAGKKYEAIRIRLIKIFTCRGCPEAEDLADETINRVVAKVGELNDYHGDPTPYFYGVSQKVQLEYLRKCKTRLAEGPAEDAAVAPTVFADGDEPEYECLERCLKNISETSRKLVLAYYQQERQAKIDHRKRLADELGIAVNALRIRAFRIRRTLEECVRACVEQQQPVH